MFRKQSANQQKQNNSGSMLDPHRSQVDTLVLGNMLEKSVNLILNKHFFVITNHDTDI